MRRDLVTVCGGGTETGRRCVGAGGGVRCGGVGGGGLRGAAANLFSYPSSL